MLRKTMAAVFALALALTAGTASAQCVLGVYADEAGTESNLSGQRTGENFNFYVVLHVEDLADAVGYSIDIPGQNVDIFVVNRSYGPDGTGINVESTGGDNVGLGGCYPGFSNVAILVTTYTAFQPNWTPSKVITLGPNPDSGGGGVDTSTYPVYSNCQGDLVDCTNTTSLTLEQPVATEATSFGAVKSLYGN